MAPGEPFTVRPGGDHLRVTIGLVDGGQAAIERLADQVAEAAGPTATRRARRPA